MARTSKPIEDLISRGGQDITARRVFKIGDLKVRITIKSDAYKFQSFARSEVWNPTELKWNQVHNIPHGQMATREGLCYLPNASGENWTHFQRDFDTLLKVTKEVLS